MSVTKSIPLQEIAKLVGGEIIGKADVAITGLAGIKQAKKGDITFLASSKYLSFVEKTQASAIITSQEVSSKDKTLVHTSNPSAAFTKIASFFLNIQSPDKKIGIHPTAVIDESASIGKEVFMGSGVVIGREVVIGEDVCIEANTFIGDHCIIGKGSHLYPNVTLYANTQLGNNVTIHSSSVLGGDGFGYETVDGKYIKIPHLGSVVVEDDVEIGSNTSIDRARFDKTIIGKGSKIDNLVQIGHNVVVGPNCLVVSQAGISGSSKLGKNVILAGQVGIADHVDLGDGVIVGAGGGVNKSIPEGIVLGRPAKPILEQKRLFALISRLPELFKDLSFIKKKLERDK